MTYGYSVDLRSRVLAYLDRGHTQKEACAVFGVSRKTIYNWLSLKEKTGGLGLKRAKRYKPSKFESNRLKDYMASHSDAYLEEIAVVFKGTASGVCRALKRLNITRKKSRFSIQSAMNKKEKSFCKA
jgi:transposase